MPEGVEFTPTDDAVQRVRWLILDVDGVLTDGRIVYADDGRELKSFHVRDGSGIKFWREAGNEIAIISGRSSPAVGRRAKELGIERIYQGQRDKREAFRELLSKTGADPSAIAAIGDDLPDLPLLHSCGVGIAVADACSELRASADYVTALPGGAGAVREAVEWILKRQGRWDAVVAGYRAAGRG